MSAHLFRASCFVSLLGLLFSCPVQAQTDDDDVPSTSVQGSPADEALWQKLDITEDGWLDGNELNGGWIRFDTDGDDEVTKEEWLLGRARERASRPQTPIRTAPKAAPKRTATPKRRTAPVRPRTATPRATPKVVKLAPVARRRGYIVGRAVKADGSPVPSFTVDYSGFEDGKLASSFGGRIYETVNSNIKASGGRYAIKVPPGAYRASAYVTYRFRGRVYNFEMEPLGTPKYDFESSQLEKLRGGLVRDFVLKMNAKKRGASEASETLYRFAYYGGTVNLDASQYEGLLGGGNQLSTPLRNAYPPESRILLTLTPAGTRVDGSQNFPVNADLPLGDDGKWTFMVRGIFPGLYTASAQLRLPDGSVKPLRVSTQPSRTQLNPGAYDRVIFDRQSSALIDFLPEDVGPAPRMGVKAVTLYLGD